MSDTITLTKDELADIVAQAAAKVAEDKGMVFSSAKAAAVLRAVGNVTNVTETLGLPLPEGNEVVAYQDFINAANLIIDNFAKTTGNTLDSVSATATAAANGVSAADQKITQINTRLTQDKVDDLPQFMTDTKDRLESVENDVMGLTGWSTKFKNIGSGTRALSVVSSSIGLITLNYNVAVSDWENLTEPVKWWFGKNVNTQFSYKALRVNAEGNLYNLPEVNTMYGISTYGISRDISEVLCGVFLKWTGVSTELYVLSNNNKGLYIDEHMWPYTESGPID